jgi:hypothetical protein
MTTTMRIWIGVAALAALWLPSPALAQPGWDGPVEIFASEFGTGPEQIGREAGSIAEYDRIPSQIFVASDGAVLLADSINRRLVVVTSGGVVSRFGPSGIDLRAGEDWPGSSVDAAILPDGATIVILHGGVLQRYARDGALRATRSGVDGILAGRDADGHVVVLRPGAPPVWDRYDDALDPIESTTVDPVTPAAPEWDSVQRLVEEPAPVGRRRVRDLRIRADGREITVQDVSFDPQSAHVAADGAVHLVLSLLDPDRTYRVQSADGTQSRDLGVPFDRVLRIDANGDIEASLDLPATEFEALQVLGDPAFDPPGLPYDSQPTVIVGGTTVDANGNVYAFRRDATHYRVLKWTRR